jgi:hypothetical protein
VIAEIAGAGYAPLPIIGLNVDRFTLFYCGIDGRDDFICIGFADSDFFHQDLGDFGDQEGQDEAVVDPADDGDEVGGDVDGAEDVDEGAEDDQPAVLGFADEFSVGVVDGVLHGWFWLLL